MGGMRVVQAEADTLSARLLEFVLREIGHEVLRAASAAETRHIVEWELVDAVVLDVDLPDMDGVALCRQLREGGFQGPLIFVSPRDDTGLKVAAFQHDADDFIVEPYDPLELAARLKVAAGRRAGADLQALGTVLKIGDVELSVADLTVRVGDRQPVALTPTELRILEALMRNSPLTVARDRLIERVWGYDWVGDSNRVDVYVSRLRRKLDPDGARPAILHTVRGIGYAFRVPAAPSGNPGGTHDVDCAAHDC